MRSALTSNEEPRPGSARVDGNVCEGARADKETKYAELLAGDRCRFVVVAVETGGKWSSEAIQFVESLASSRAREGATHTGEAGQPSWHGGDHWLA